MKNFQKFALGLLVAVLAIGFSAFTNNENIAAGDIYGNKTAGYTKLNSPYVSGNCGGSASTACAYRVTTAGASHVTATFNDTQAEEFLDEGWIVQQSTGNGIYSGN